MRRAGAVVYCAAGSGLAADVSVLLVAADEAGKEAWAQDVQSKLLATGAFASVDIFDASSATPALSVLQGYDVVLVWRVIMFASPSGVGDVLAQYWDGGGAVVVAVFATAGDSLQGLFGTAANGYVLIDGTANQEAPSDSLGSVLEPKSPLMAGVASISATQAYRSTGAVINGGAVVAQWASNGRPLVVRGTRAGRPLVAVNMFPPSSNAEGGFWAGDGAVLMRNALLYSACAPCAAGTFATAGARPTGGA